MGSSHRPHCDQACSRERDHADQRLVGLAPSRAEQIRGGIPNRWLALFRSLIE